VVEIENLNLECRTWRKSHGKCIKAKLVARFDLADFESGSVISIIGVQAYTLAVKV
jgi:hypothetical protein